MSLNYELTLTNASIDLNEIPTFTLNNVTADYNSRYSLFMKPAISLSCDNLSGINCTFNPGLIRLGSSSKINISVKDLAEEGSNQIVIRSNFTIFKSFACNSEVNASFKLMVPKIITLTCDKQSPQVSGAEIMWTAKYIPDSKRSLFYTFYDDLKFPNRPMQSSNNSTWTWSTDLTDVGNHEIRVVVTDNSDPSWNESQKASFYITTCTPPKVKLDKVGRNTFHAIGEFNSSCNKNILYKFLISENNKTWRKQWNWSNRSEWVANPPLIPGIKYYLQVKIRDDLHNPEVPQQTWIGSNYTKEIYLESEGPFDSEDQDHLPSETRPPAIITTEAQPTVKIATETQPPEKITTKTQPPSIIKNARILLADIKSKMK